MDLSLPISATILGMTMVFLTLGILIVVTDLVGRFIRNRERGAEDENGDIHDDQGFRSSKEDIAIISAFDDWATQRESDVSYGNEYTAYLNGKSYLITLLRKEGEEILAEVSGKRYNLNKEQIKRGGNIADGESEAGDSKKAGDSKQVIKAPLPGEVRNILVKKGTRIEGGQPLLTLEAMKMENEVNSDIGGVVSDIMVSKRDKVEEGQELLTIERG